MHDREKVLAALKNCIDEPKCKDCPWEECEGEHEHVEMPKGLVEAVVEMMEGNKTVPNELKNKMWNALFAKEDKCEKHYAGTENNDTWYLHWRPWLQTGFGVAIDAIAEWEEGKADA
jgi:hypothetical protein